VRGAPAPGPGAGARPHGAACYAPGRMKFCPLCAAPTRETVPEGDDRPRAVCTACGAIHYQNPRTVVGCLIEHDGKLLLCRRAIEPAHGLWTPPAGYLEIGESALDGAVRETHEEARARVEILAPHSYLDLPHIGQHYALYRARLAEPAFEAGPESLEVALFDLDALPWDELAFPVIHFALRLLLEDRERGAASLHLGVVRWSGTGSRFDAARYELRDHLRVPLAP